MSDEELMRIAFEDKRTVKEVLRFIFELGEQKGRADREAEIKPLLKAIKFVLEDYSIRLGDYAKVIDERLKEQKNE